MSKLKRTRRKPNRFSEFENIFISNYFVVNFWNDEKYPITSIFIKPDTNNIIYLKGKCLIKSDKVCFEQLSTKEIIKMIECNRQDAFHNGRMDKIREFNDVLKPKFKKENRL